MTENSGQKRQFRVESRSLVAKYDDMTGLGLLPVGLFSFMEEKYSQTKEKNAPTMDDYYKTSRVKRNRPE